MSQSEDFWPPHKPQKPTPASVPPAAEPTEEPIYELEPPTAEQAERRRRRLEKLVEPLEPVEELPETGPDWQLGYSLKQLFGLLLIASVLLGVMRLFPPAVAAGFAGLAVLAGLSIMSLGEPPAFVQMTWWILLATYIMAALYALWTGR